VAPRCSVCGTPGRTTQHASGAYTSESRPSSARSSRLRRKKPADLAGADARYEEISARIRARTRDRSRFGLLFSENVNYGMRRNLLGLKPLGIWVAALTVIASALLLLLTHGSLSARATHFGPGGTAGLLLLAFWLLVVTEDWVRTPAEAYADQFIAAIEILHGESSSRPITQ
jgi:hypothetical protein